MENERLISKWEYHFRQVKYIALEYKGGDNLDFMYQKTVEKQSKYPAYLLDYENRSRDDWEDFRVGLRGVLRESKNWEVEKCDLVNRFLPMINKYSQWYEQHKEETKRFEPFNSYRNYYEMGLDTIRELEVYFGQLESTLSDKKKNKNLSAGAKEPTKKEKTIQKEKNYFSYTNKYVELRKSVNPKYNRERAIAATLKEFGISERTLGRAFDANRETLIKFGHEEKNFKSYSRVKWS